jgi:hypothetical protein
VLFLFSSVLRADSTLVFEKAFSNQKLQVVSRDDIEEVKSLNEKSEETATSRPATKLRKRTYSFNLISSKDDNSSITVWRRASYSIVGIGDGYQVDPPTGTIQIMDALLLPDLLIVVYKERGVIYAKLLDPAVRADALRIPEAGSELSTDDGSNHVSTTAVIDRSSMIVSIEFNTEKEKTRFFLDRRPDGYRWTKLSADSNIGKAQNR